MHANVYYSFYIGTKIPFSEWPDIVQSYMKQQGLHYSDFFYTFEGLPKVIARAAKECPELGPVRTRQGKNAEDYYLSNIESDTGCTEQMIMSLMPKIYRRYGFSESYLYYDGVDFFSRTYPKARQAPTDEPDWDKRPCITLYRDSVFPRFSSIDLDFVLHDDSGSYDPAPYVQAMKQLLPGVRHTAHTQCCLSDAEKAEYERLNREAEPLLDAVRSYLEDKLPPPPEFSFLSAKAASLSVAPALRKLCRRYGFSYIRHYNGNFYIQKRSTGGHYIFLDIGVAPTCKRVELLVKYIVAGFEHRLAFRSFLPDDQADMESWFTECFDVLCAAEKEVFPPLAAHFPPSPDWYAPEL